MRIRKWRSFNEFTGLMPLGRLVTPFLRVFLLSGVLFLTFQNATAANLTAQEHRVHCSSICTPTNRQTQYRLPARVIPYLPEAIDQLDRFLRDHRTGDVIALDPRLFDLLSDLTAAVGRAGTEIDIVCGKLLPYAVEQRGSFPTQRPRELRSTFAPNTCWE